ncbi:MAG: hypothetical protein ACE5GK_11145 [Nitrospiria bacterium]
MQIKKVSLDEILSILAMSLIVLAIALNPSRSSAQGFGAQGFGHPSSESSQPKTEEDDPHRRFREGSREEMMREMMGGMMKNPHSKSSPKNVHPPFSAQGLKVTLELDDGQSKKMRELLSEYRKGIILKKAQLRVAQIELDEMVADQAFVLDEVKKKARKRESAATALTMLRVKALAGARDFLSKAQFEKFMGMLTHQMSSHGKKGMHGMRGRHPGSKGPHGRSSSRHRFFSGHGKSGGSFHGGNNEEAYDE